jgi:hypothetical protein
MSVGFGQRGGNRPPPNPAQVQKMLDENGHLIQTIQEYQSKGKAPEILQYQQALHRNLTYLATMADAAQNVQSFLPVSVNKEITNKGISDVECDKKNSVAYESDCERNRSCCLLYHDLL